MVAVVGSGWNVVWIGGSDQKEEENWRWSDQSHWGFEAWEPGYGHKELCGGQGLPGMMCQALLQQNSSVAQV